MSSSTRHAVPEDRFSRKPASLIGSLIARVPSRVTRRLALVSAAFALALAGSFTGLAAPSQAAAANVAFPDLPVGFAKAQLAGGPAIAYFISARSLAASF